jgi:hypothetical protein
MLIVEYVRMWMLLLCVVQSATVLQFLWLESCSQSDSRFGSFEVDQARADAIVDLSHQHAMMASSLKWPRR